MNHDGEVNGADIQPFTDCLLGEGNLCGCAEMDGLPGLTPEYMTAFISQLLTND
ncbi:MAG: hypothetical protein IPK83_05860 [Planctomycetes bacterium]|nr:hypothetical protein [Planctomycetota bacterium]